MHSLATYLIKCHNPRLEGEAEEKYALLDKIGSSDFLILLKEFIEIRAQEWRTFDESKTVYKFSNTQINVTGREICGWFEAGQYGQKNDIIDIETGKVSYEKTMKHATVKKHFYHFYIPAGEKEGLSFMHVDSGIGIKTVFYGLFSTFFKSKTNLNFRMLPLSYDKALDNWQESEAKSIVVEGFNFQGDKADAVLKGLNYKKTRLVLVPKKRQTFGRLNHFLDVDSDQAKAVAVLSEHGAQVKTTFLLNKKRRTLTVDKVGGQIVCDVDFDEDVILVEGVPDFVSLLEWSRSMMNDFIRKTYGNKGYRVP